MRGVLSPVSLSTLKFYYDQSWPREVLLMMFIKQIEIDKTSVKKLEEAFKALCEADKERAYCAKSLPPGALSLDKVVDDYLAKAADPVVFDNYPSESNQSVTRFQAMLRILIALGLKPVVDTQLKVVIPNLPAKNIGSFAGMSDVASGKLVISPRTLPNPTIFAVCTKANLTGFTIDKEVITKVWPKGAGQLVAQNSPSPPDMNAAMIVGTTADDCAKQAFIDESKHKSAVPTGAPDNTVFKFTTRSLDSMIFYLGEDLRYGGQVVIWNMYGDDGTKAEKLFSVELGNRDSDALVATKYRGQTYVIPDICGHAINCEHRSLQVLSLLNQIWGLQKEAAEQPSVPVVSVIH
jgi:hypothetical protein